MTRFRNQQSPHTLGLCTRLPLQLVEEAVQPLKPAQVVGLLLAAPGIVLLAALALVLDRLLAVAKDGLVALQAKEHPIVLGELCGGPGFLKERVLAANLAFSLDQLTNSTLRFLSPSEGNKTGLEAGR